MSPGRRILHLVRAGRCPEELSAPPPGHAVAELPGPGASPEEWDRLLERILDHEVIVPW